MYVLEDLSRHTKPAPVEYVNIFAQLDQADSSCSDKHTDSVDVNIDLSNRVKTFVRSKGERRLRVATWKFSGLCNERKQKEV